MFNSSKETDFEINTFINIKRIFLLILTWFSEPVYHENTPINMDQLYFSTLLNLNSEVLIITGIPLYILRDRLKEWVQLHFKTNGHRRYKHLT